MKIKYKIPVVFISVTVGLVLIYFAITALLSASMLIESEKKAYEEMAVQTADAVNIEVERELHQLQSLASNENIIAAAEFRNANPDAPYSSSEYEEINQYFYSMVASDDYYVSMFLADKTGTTYAASTPEYVGLDINDRTYYQESMLGNLYVSDVLSSKADGTKFIVASCPIMSNGEVIGTINRSVDVERIYGIASTLTSGETGFAFLVDSNNTIVYHPDESLIGTEIDDSTMEEIVNVEENITFEDFDGNDIESPNYVYSQTLPGLNWTMVFTKELSEILAPLKAQVISSFAFGVILLGVVAVTTIVISRKITNPLNDLVDTVNTARDDLSIRSNIVSNDEIGILSNEINGMIQAIQSKNDEIEKLAYYNEITKLPNKNRLEKDFEVFTNEDPQNTGVLISIRVDKFRNLNETYGRVFGNIILKKVSRKLKRFEEHGVLYHFGNDEFIFFIPKHISKDDIYEKWNEVESAFVEPFVISNKTITISLITAVTSFDGSTDINELQYSNDLTMRHAKENDQKIAFFSESFSELALRQEKVKDAISSGIVFQEGFYCEYQPQIDVKQMKVVGVETLVRYKDPDLGFVSPGELIPIAESNGQMVSLGEKIMRDAFRFVQGWNKKDLGSLRVAINVSPAQLADDNFTNFVNEMFRRFNVAPENIEFEITESMMIEIMDSKAGGVLDVLEGFRKKGITIAIDDFGTGYSSLSYLSSMPVDIIKIDKAFVDDIATNSSSKVLVENIIKMSHDLDAKVIIEGVETEEQFNVLSTLGSDIVQGFYFCKPLSEDAVKDFVNNMK